MQPPTPPASEPPQQPPAWTQYDLRNASTPVHATLQPQTAWQRQVAIYHYDLAQWAKRLSMPIPAVAITLACLVLCSCAFWGVAGLDALTAPGRSQAAAVGATQTASAPTATIGPTATPFPTLPPTATPTVQQRVQQIVDATANGSTFEVAVSYQGNVAIVNETLWAGASVTADDCKQEIFKVQRAIWQQSAIKPREVDINIIGPLQDKYGRVSNGPYAHSMILASSAKLYVWANLDADSAWDAYDEAYIRPDL